MLLVTQTYLGAVSRNGIDLHGFLLLIPLLVKHFNKFTTKIPCQIIVLIFDKSLIDCAFQPFFTYLFSVKKICCN